MFIVMTDALLSIVRIRVRSASFSAISRTQSNHNTKLIDRPTIVTKHQHTAAWVHKRIFRMHPIISQALSFLRDRHNGASPDISNLSGRKNGITTKKLIRPQTQAWPHSGTSNQCKHNRNFYRGVNLNILVERTLCRAFLNSESMIKANETQNLRLRTRIPSPGVGENWLARGGGGGRWSPFPGPPPSLAPVTGP